MNILLNGANGRMGKKVFEICSQTENVTAVCGIGKVFAAICAQTMILTFKPEIIVNTGVAGSIDTSLKVFDIAVADKVEASVAAYAEKLVFALDKAA